MQQVDSRVGAVVNNSKNASREQKEQTSATATVNTGHSETQVISRCIFTSQSRLVLMTHSGSSTNIEEADAALIKLYPPTSTSLCSLPKERRILLLHAMLLLLLSLEHYVAHSRILLLHISSSLHLPLHILAEEEMKVAQGLLEAAKEMSGDEETKKRGHDNTVARRWKVGLAGVAGAAIIGVTGGLAAPLVAGASELIPSPGMRSDIVAPISSKLAAAYPISSWHRNLH